MDSFSRAHHRQPHRRLRPLRAGAGRQQGRRAGARRRAPGPRRGDAPGPRPLRPGLARRPRPAGRGAAVSRSTRRPGAAIAGRAAAAVPPDARGLRRRAARPRRRRLRRPDAVPGVPAALDAARAAGMRLAFVTNNAARTPDAGGRAPHRAGRARRARRRDHQLARPRPRSSPSCSAAGARVLPVGGPGRRGRPARRRAHGRRAAEDEPARGRAGLRAARSAGRSWPRPSSRCAAAPGTWPPTPTRPSRRRAARCRATARWSASSARSPGQPPLVTGKPDPAMHARVRPPHRRPSAAGGGRPARHRHRGRPPRRAPPACSCSPASPTPPTLLAAGPDQRPDLLARDAAGCWSPTRAVTRRRRRLALRRLAVRPAEADDAAWCSERTAGRGRRRPGRAAGAVRRPLAGIPRRRPAGSSRGGRRAAGALAAGAWRRAGGCRVRAACAAAAGRAARRRASPGRSPTPWRSAARPSVSATRSSLVIVSRMSALGTSGRRARACMSRTAPTPAGRRTHLAEVGQPAGQAAVQALRPPGRRRGRPRTPLQGGHALVDRRHARAPPRQPSRDRARTPDATGLVAAAVPASGGRYLRGRRRPPAPAADAAVAAPGRRPGETPHDRAERAATRAGSAAPRARPARPPATDRAGRRAGARAGPVRRSRRAAGRRARRRLRGRARPAAARARHHRPALMVRRAGSTPSWSAGAGPLPRAGRRAASPAGSASPAGRHQAGHRGRARHAGPRPDRPRRARLGLPRRAQAARRAGRASGAGRGPAGARRRRLHRRVHRRAAAPRRPRGGRGRRRLRPAGLVAAHRRAGARARPHQRPRADPRADRRPGRARRRRPVLHLAAPGAAGAGRLHRARRRPAADGQAAVRGRPGAARRGGRGPRPAPRAEAVAQGRRAGARAGAGHRRGGDPQPAAGPGRQRRVLPLAAPGRAPPVGRRPRSAKVPGEPRATDRCQRAPADDRGRVCWSPTPAGGTSSTGPARSARCCSTAGFEVRMLDDEAADLGVTDAEAVPPDESAAAGCEVVLVLGGDGTFLRAAELARPCRRRAARGQPRPGRVPRRDRAGGAAGHPRHASSAASTRWRSGSPSTSTSSTSAAGRRPGTGRSTRRRWRRPSASGCSRWPSRSTAGR